MVIDLKCFRVLYDLFWKCDVNKVSTLKHDNKYAWLCLSAVFPPTAKKYKPRIISAEGLWISRCCDGRVAHAAGGSTHTPSAHTHVLVTKRLSHRWLVFSVNRTATLVKSHSLGPSGSEGALFVLGEFSWQSGLKPTGGLKLLKTYTFVGNICALWLFQMNEWTVWNNLFNPVS